MMEKEQLKTVVNSVFKRHKLKDRFSGVFLTYKTAEVKYFVSIYPVEKFNQNAKGLHCCRIDTNTNDNVYHVKPENLIKWLNSVKKHLEWKRKIYKQKLSSNNDFESREVELSLFLNSQF